MTEQQITVEADPQRRIVHRGDHDDGHEAVVVAGSEPAGELDAVDVRHDVVDEHKVELHLVGTAQRLDWVQQAFDVGPAELADDMLQERQTGAAIVDYENAHPNPHARVNIRPHYG